MQVSENHMPSPKPNLGPSKPPIQCLPGSLSPGLVADTSPPSSAEVVNEWSYTAIPHTPLWHSQAQPYFYNYNAQVRWRSVPSIIIRPTRCTNFANLFLA